MGDILNQKAILVLGMHRSGTSAVTAGIEALGVSLGDISYESNFDNAKGFFENMEVVRFNESLFQECGFSWDNPFFCLKPEQQQIIGSFSNEAVTLLLKYYKDEPIWAMKDPRLCVFLNFWQGAIKKAQCGELFRVYMLRNPFEVAASLKRRGKKNQQYLGGDERASILMWFFHVFQALNSVDNDRNIMVTFEDLLEDPLQQLDRIASFLQIKPDLKLVEKYSKYFLEKEMRHHSDSTDMLRKKYPEFDFVADFYEDVIAFRKRPSFMRDSIKEVLSKMPDLKMLLACSEVALPVFQDAVRVVSLQQSVADSINILSEKDIQIEGLSQTVLSQNHSLSERETQVLNLTQTVLGQEHSLSERDTQVLNLTQTVLSQEHSLSKKDTQVLNLVETLSDLENSVLIRNEQINRLQQDLTVQKTYIGHLGKEVENKEKEIQSNQNDIFILNQQYENLKEKYTRVTSRLCWQAVSKFIDYVFRIPGMSRIARFERRTVRKLRLKKVKAVIVKSGLFDADFYLTTNPDIRENGLNPLLHFINYGGFEGRWPNPEFDPAYYLESFPDAALTGLNPLYHYLLYGTERELPIHKNLVEHPIEVEGVETIDITVENPVLSDPFFSLDEIQVIGCLDLIDPSKETILVVSHEGSRTGAPILSYNLVTKLLKQYNVIALFLGPGPIAEACYKEGAVAIVTPKEYCWQPEKCEDVVVALIHKNIGLKYALVNSIESRGILKPLSRAYIPIVSLIHEFASYTRPSNAFQEAVFWSNNTVFSSSITHENMVAEHPYLGRQRFVILPQGHCRVPKDDVDVKKGSVEVSVPHSVQEIVRPKKFPANGIVVLGAGFVQMRKGVDLFISCVAEVIARSPEIVYRFVWVGKGYNPENDLAYSVYLADQVRRAGLEKYVFFMNEVADIEAVYAQSDIMLLSSRLDPLPNVAIDAFLNDLPVVCFSRTTGIAEVLDNFGLADFCVADYLNVTDMADKVVKLAESEELREKVAAEAGRQAVAVFNMDHYVEQLDQLGKQAEQQILMEKEDVRIITDSGLLNVGFSVPPQLDEKDPETMVRYYVRSWSSNVLPRKLFPGFHPGIYLEKHGTAVSGGDPLADYLKAGKPDGPWCFDVISPANQCDIPLTTLRVGLHIHVFYPKLLSQLLDRLKQNSVNLELLVSVVSESDRDFVNSLLKEREFKYRIRITPNRGRDIGPFLTEFGAQILAEFDIIGHMHTKKSIDCDQSMGEKWYEFLLENLIGGQAPMADIILGKMCENENIGMVFPDDPHVVSWDANYSYGEKLLKQLGVKDIPKEFAMPVGTMFWARSSALRKLFDIQLQWEDYPEEPVPYDGTLLHAIERSLGILVQSCGKSIVLTNVSEVSR